MSEGEIEAPKEKPVRITGVSGKHERRLDKDGIHLAVERPQLEPGKKYAFLGSLKTADSLRTLGPLNLELIPTIPDEENPDAVRVQHEGHANRPRDLWVLLERGSVVEVLPREGSLGEIFCRFVSGEVERTRDAGRYKFRPTEKEMEERWPGLHERTWAIEDWTYDKLQFQEGEAPQEERKKTGLFGLFRRK